MRIGLDLKDDKVRKDIRKALMDEVKSLTRAAMAKGVNKEIKRVVANSYDIERIRKMVAEQIKSTLKVKSWDETKSQVIIESMERQLGEIITKQTKDLSWDKIKERMEKFNVDSHIANLIKEELQSQLDGMKLQLKFGNTEEQSDIWAAIEQLRADSEGKKK